MSVVPRAQIDVIRALLRELRLNTARAIFATTHDDSRIPRAICAVGTEIDDVRVVMSESDGIFGEDDVPTPPTNDCSFELFFEVAAGAERGIGSFPSEEFRSNSREEAILQYARGVGHPVNDVPVDGGDDFTRPGRMPTEGRDLLFSERCGPYHEQGTIPATRNEQRPTRERLGKICHGDLLEWGDKKERRKEDSKNPLKKQFQWALIYASRTAL